jgi:hypothetical protein
MRAKGKLRSWAGVGAAALLAAALTGTGGNAAAAPPTFDHLRPGQVADYRETVPVQLVFLGYDRGLVDEAKVRAELPATASPRVRSRLFYGLPGELGLHYRFDYRVSYTDAGYEDRFFGRLSALARRQSTVDGLVRTPFQQAYNEQRKNVLDVGANFYIDAPSVERWLVENPAPGVDNRRNTIYFVNWWGRGDFKFHTYTKFGEPDPDTGYDFGVNRPTRKLIAWGGTPATDEETGFGRNSRTWFYDLSAGPEAWTSNWNVDDPDVDGDGVADVRFPPIWEYLADYGFRFRGKLSGDLGRIARYVGLDLLFATSPLYPPVLTPDKLPRTVNLDLNTYEGLPGVNASARYVKPAYLRQEESELVGLPMTVDSQDLPFDAKARECFRGEFSDPPFRCYTNRPDPPYIPFANLFLNNAEKKALWRDGGGDYEVGSFHYATPDAPTPLGYADDNWLDGTQSGVFSFVSPGILEAGYGLTTTDIHEVGHHLGMSHPHDGYDPATGVQFNGLSGPFHFANVGDETNSMMSYIDLNWDFSTFDQDNAARFYAASYTTQAQRVARKVLDSPGADRGLADLRAADAAVGRAKAQLAEHSYPAAFASGRAAYESTRAAAAKAGVRLVASDFGWFVIKPGSPRASRIPGYANDQLPWQQRVRR